MNASSIRTGFLTGTLSGVLAALSSSSATAAPTTLQCVSRDFQPARFEGQGLILTLDGQGLLAKVEKMRGSWFGDTGVVNSPRLLRKTPQAAVYEVNFEASESYNGRIVLQTRGPVLYQFSWASDERIVTSRFELACRPLTR